jgi:hypothetical protein
MSRRIEKIVDAIADGTSTTGVKAKREALEKHK